MTANVAGSTGGVSIGQTTDATPTNFTVITLDADGDVVVYDNLTIVGRVSGVEEYYIRTGTRAVYTRGGSTVTEREKSLGTETRLTLAGTVTADIIISSTNIQIKCTGEAAKTIDWYSLVSCGIK